MRRICEVCGRSEDAVAEKTEHEHDLLVVCDDCSVDLMAHANSFMET